MIERPFEPGVQPDPANLLMALAHHGAVCLRPFEADREDFEAYTRRLCSRFHHTAGRREYRVSDGDGFSTSTAPTNFVLLAHAEGAFRAYATPDVGFFHCQESPQRPGGETFVVDGRRFLEAMPPDLANRFRSQGVVYESRWTPERWTVEFGVEDTDGLERELRSLDCVSHHLDGQDLCLQTRATAVAPTRDGSLGFVNALLGHLRAMSHPAYVAQPHFTVETNRVYFGDGEPIPDSVINTLIDVQDAVAVDHRWQDGDLLVLDNKTVMHGRRATLGDCPRRISVRFGHLRPEWAKVVDQT